jgi:hypothetical protein
MVRLLLERLLDGIKKMDVPFLVAVFMAISPMLVE